MKVKDFFKSQTFKCIMVLLVIALISGGLLAIFSDVFSVSEEERTLRAIKSIYGEEIAYETVFDADTDADSYAATDAGFIEKAYLLADGNYLIKATGKNGYKSGTVTLWGVVSTDGDAAAITKLSVASYEQQTLMSKFDSKTLDKAKDDDIVVSGATFSSAAINNAVAAIRHYADNSLLR